MEWPACWSQSPGQAGEPGLGHHQQWELGFFCSRWQNPTLAKKVNPEFDEKICRVHRLERKKEQVRLEKNPNEGSLVIWMGGMNGSTIRMNQLWLLQGGKSRLKGHADPLPGGAGLPDWQYPPNCPPWGVAAPPGKMRREEEMDAGWAKMFFLSTVSSPLQQNCSNFLRPQSFNLLEVYEKSMLFFAPHVNTNELNRAESASNHWVLDLKGTSEVN